jgi:hypothetical protein
MKLLASPKQVETFQAAFVAKKETPKTTKTAIVTKQQPLPLPIVQPEAARILPKPIEAPKTIEPIKQVETPKAVEAPLPIENIKPETPKEVIPEKKTATPDWRMFTKTKKGAENLNAAAMLYTSDPEVRKTFAKPQMIELAKSVSNGGKEAIDVNTGWPKFLASVEGRLKVARQEPDFRITNKKELGDLRLQYKRMAKSHRRNELMVDKDGKASLVQGSSENLGDGDKLIMDFNAKNHLPSDSGEIVGVSKQRYFDKDLKYSDLRQKFDDDVAKMRNIDGKKYIPLGITAKGQKNVLYAKFDPSYVKIYDKNPSKYNSNTKAPITDEDKFLRVLAVDALNVSKDISQGDFVKRSNLLFGRSDQYSGADAETTRVNVHNLLSPFMGEESHITPDMFVDPKSTATAKAIASFKAGSRFDGKFFIGEELFDKLVKESNYNPSKVKSGLKLSISGNIDGQNAELIRMIQKGHAEKMDPALREMFKNEFGRDVGPNDIMSFNTNVKIGPKQGIVPIKLSHIYTKPVFVGETGRITVSHERNYLQSDPGVKADMMKQTNERMSAFQSLNDEISASKNQKEFAAVLEKFADKYKINKDTLFYGPLGEAFDLGASKINLSHNIDKILKNIFLETVITGKLPNSTRAFFTPDIKMFYDGKNSPARYAKNDEVVLGSALMKKRNIKEGDMVMVSRDPVVDINNILILKAVEGDKLGRTSLGNENAIVSSFNERVVMTADQDGDKMLIVKVGEDGLPESYANAIKTRGAKAIPVTEVIANEAQPLSATGIQDTIKSQLVGDEQTSKINMINRVISTFKDNQLTVKVSPGFGKKSTYVIISNGKVVDSGTTFKVKKGFIVKPKWTDTERQLRSQAVGEAVDSKKSKDIIVRTEDNNPVWMVKQVFSDIGGGAIDDAQAKAVEGTLKNLQMLHQIEETGQSVNSIDELFTKIQPATTMLKKIKDSGMELTPWQEKILSSTNFKGFRISNPVKVEADKAGSLAVAAQIKDFDPSNPKLLEIRKKAIETKGIYSKKTTSFTERKNSKENFEEFFLKNLEDGKYTQKDLDDIAYWAATSREGNIKHNYMDKVYNPDGTINYNILRSDKFGGHWPSTKLVYRYNNLINPSKKVSKVYYENSEAYEEPVKDKK